MQTGTWLRSVRASEVEQGISHRELACDAGKLTSHVRERLARAQVRLARVIAMIPSADEDEAAQREVWEDGRQGYVDLLCAAVADLGSALTAVGCSDCEVAGASGLLIGTPPPLEPEAVIRRCAVCEKEVGETPLRSMLLPVGVYLCDEELCEERYDGAETVQISVRDIRQRVTAEVAE